MKVENMVNVLFTEQEVVKALIDAICFRANEMNQKTHGKEAGRLFQIVEQAEKNIATCSVEFDNGHFTLLIDGVAFVDEVPDATTIKEDSEVHACFGTCNGECQYR